MNEVAISVKDISKRFRIGARDTAPDSLVQAITNVIKSPFRNYKQLRQLTNFTKEDETVFWALKNITFEVRSGEVLGIIGHNGAGKSTLLKILSRITEPTTGEAKLYGRVSSLLEVGTGFHPDLTGRENVYMNGTILGMTKKEIDRRFDEIIEFSGIEKHIDTPVKFYSSGMKVRLGFAVAAHLDPEILIIDEVLAVGDLGFQRKCLGMMKDVSRSGRTVIFVSHNMPAVENLCTKALLIHGGSITYSGPVKETIKRYIDEFRPQENGDFFQAEVPRAGSGKVQFTSFSIINEDGKEITSVQSGSTFALTFGFKTNSKDVRNVDVGYSIHDIDDESLLFIQYSSSNGVVYNSLPSTGKFTCLITELPLPEGRYLVRGMILENGTNSDSLIKGLGYLDVIEGDFFGTGYKSNRFTKERPKFLVKGKWI